MMRFVAAVLVVAALPVQAAEYTSVKSGTWTDHTVWSPDPGAGNYPGMASGSSDNVKLASGFNVDIPAGTEIWIGTSPANDTGTPAVRCTSTSGTGQWSIHGTVHIKGPVSQCNALWEAFPGALIDAAGPNTYRWKVSAASGQAGNARFRATGASFTRTGAGIFNLSTLYGGKIELYSNTLDGWGASATTLITFYQYSGTAIILEGNTITNCGPITSTDNNFGADTILRLRNNKISAPADASKRVLKFTGINTAPSGGERVISHNVITGQFAMTVLAPNTINGFTITENIFIQPDATNKALYVCGGAVALMDRNMIWSEGSSSGQGMCRGTVSRTLYVFRRATIDDHFFRVASPETSITVDGLIAEYWDNSAESAQVYVEDAGVPTSLVTVTLRNLLGVVSGTGGSSGPMLVSLASDHTKVHFLAERNTWFGPTTDKWVGAENSSPTAGSFTMRNNLLWRSAQSDACRAFMRVGAGTDEDGSYEGFDYNWFRNCAYVTWGNVYMVATESKYANPSPPGAHDVKNADPQFVESGRNFLTWGQRLKPSLGTPNDVLLEMKKMNDPDFDSRFTILNCYNWVRAGFRPLNPAVRTAAHDGGRVGAVDPDRMFGWWGNGQ